MPFPHRKIGNDNVSALGLGCMGMSFGYTSFGSYDDQESMRVLTTAADSGMTFWDTADIYGPRTNEELLGKWFAQTGRRNEIFLATKFGNEFDDQGKQTGRIVGTHDYVKACCNASLKRLGVDCIDLYYQHRVDPDTPIEVTVRAMVELKNEGKIRHLGLSECSAQTLRRACVIHPIAAAQMEFSPFALEILSEQTNFLKTCRDLGVTLIAYSPLGRGFLTGAITSRADFDADDSRLNQPRMSEENFPGNLKLVREILKIAERKGCTSTQLTLAWVMAHGPDVIPIPGTKRVKYLEENIKAAYLELSDDEVKAVTHAVESVGGVKGARFAPGGMTKCFADSPEEKK